MIRSILKLNIGFSMSLFQGMSSIDSHRVDANKDYDSGAGKMQRACSRPG